MLRNFNRDFNRRTQRLIGLIFLTNIGADAFLEIDMLEIMEEYLLRHTNSYKTT